MCSTPKGRGGRPQHSSAVNGLVSNMSAAEYSSMVQRANESYERRQEELAEIRAKRREQKKHEALQHTVDSENGFIQQLSRWIQRLRHHQKA